MRECNNNNAYIYTIIIGMKEGKRKYDLAVLVDKSLDGSDVYHAIRQLILFGFTLLISILYTHAHTLNSSIINLFIQASEIISFTSVLFFHVIPSEDAVSFTQTNYKTYILKQYCYDVMQNVSNTTVINTIISNFSWFFA